MVGAQTPSFCVEPARVGTDGALAAQLMEGYGSALDPWQRRILDCWLGTDGEGRFTTTSAGLTVPRQNGKNVCLEAREFYGIAILGERVLHTAHQVRTSKKAFRRLVALFTDKRFPEIMELVRQIRFTNGEECIELTNGGSIEFSSRSRQAARGYDGISLVVYDEAQELTDDQVEAIMATLSASATGSRQILYTGTPPYPGCPGEVFRRRRQVCQESPGPHDAWHEWSVKAESAADIHVGDPKLWYATNPALGIRLSEEFTGEELRTMSADGFAGELLRQAEELVADPGDSGGAGAGSEGMGGCRIGRAAPGGQGRLRREVRRRRLGGRARRRGDLSGRQGPHQSDRP